MSLADIRRGRLSVISSAAARRLLALGLVTLVGSLLALGASLSFAVFNVLLRRGRANDMMPCVVIAGLVAAAIAAPMALAAPGGLALGARDLALCIAMGTVQVGFGLTVFTIGARHVSAVELALLSMSELVLAPLWVWLAVDEVPSVYTLAGGAILMTAIAFQALSGVRRRRLPPMA